MILKKTITFLAVLATLNLSWGFVFASMIKSHSVQIQLFSQRPVQKIILNATKDFSFYLEKINSGKKELVHWPQEKPLTLSIKNNVIHFPKTSLPQARRIEVTSLTPGYLNISGEGLHKIFLGESLNITTQQQRLHMIAKLPLERYVATVLASELPPDFPLAALKAQAVLIRTRALQKKSPHQREGFQFCDSTHCQLFQEKRNHSDKFLAATHQTKGLVLTYQQKPIEALYHSSCGGKTSANQDVFGGRALSYLQGTVDQNEQGQNYCADSPHAQWQGQLDLEEARQIFAKPHLENISVIDHDHDGRAEEILLQGQTTQKILAQDFLLKIGRQLGWHRLKSAAFQITRKNEKFLFTGVGLGHGVGLCQWGARGMALAGHDYVSILRHYFPGTQLQSME